MLAPDGYTLRKCLQQTAQSEIHLAMRARDGQEVLLRGVRGRESDEQLRRLRVEHEALSRAAGPGVIRVLELDATGLQPLLVLANPGGVSLEEWIAGGPLSPEVALEIALRLARSLERLHEARWVHRELSPSGIWIDPGSGETTLVDLGHAQPYGAAGVEESAPAGSASALLYSAPEQLGRMNRGVDFRSDLYSLGAIFYHALTGRPPFESDDALALIHAHMARMPAPPLERRAELPPTLSRIAMKLLQKEPDERYQTARAVSGDLSECLSQLRRTGRIDDHLRLATADAPFRPLFSKRLYGRECEVDALRRAYAQAAQGDAHLLLLRGPPGIGKSVLVGELRAALAETGGYLALGKFDQYRALPFAGFAGAFASFVDQILVESEEHLTQWRRELRPALGSLAGALLDLVPDLALILGELPPLPPLGPAETRARLILAVERFVRATATSRHPLVLFLDDLQWSDAGSRELLVSLLQEREGTALLLIGAYRDSEVGPDHPLRELLEGPGRELAQGALELAPLGLPAIAQMLGEALQRPPEAVLYLAEQVELKTGGTPLMIQQFVQHMHELGVIRFVAPQGWTWEDGAIAAARIPEGAVGLMVARLERLAAKPRALIQFASCVADEFERGALAALMGEPVSALEPVLFTLAEQGLLAPSPRGFRFVHDRVREAAQALLSEHERAVLHRRAGILLLESTPPEERGARSFAIADHLNRARSVLQGEERAWARASNLEAGQRALASGAAATSSSYFAEARALLEPDTWEVDGDQAAAIFSGSAEAARQTEAFALAIELLDVLDAHPQDALQQAKAWALRLRVLSSMSADAAAAQGPGPAQLTHRMLRKLGIRWPRYPSKLRVAVEILRIDWLLRGPLDGRLFPGERPRDDAWMAPCFVVEAGGSAWCNEAPAMACFLAGLSIRLQRRYAPVFSPGMALGVYAAFRVTATLDPQPSLRLAQAALDWMKRSPHVVDVRGELCVHAFVRSWTEPRHKVLGALHRTADAALEVGDLEFAVYALRNLGDYSLLCGRPLEESLREFEKLGRHHALQNAAYYSKRFVSLYGLLRGAGIEPDAWRRELADAQRELSDSQDHGIYVFWSLWVAVLCTLGEYAAAGELAESIAEDLFAKGTPGSSVVDFTTLRGLAAFAQAAALRGRARRRQLRVARRCVRRLRGWSRCSPDFAHMAQWLQVEELRARGDARRALSAYLDVARRAQDRGYVQHAALILERRAELLQAGRRAREAVLDYAEAAARYRAWGASGKAAALEQRRRALLSAPPG